MLLDELVPCITSQTPKDDYIQKKYDRLNLLNLLALSQMTVQVLDNSKSGVLIGKQTCTREKGGPHFLFLCYSKAWLSASLVPALGLHLTAQDF